MSKKKNSAAAVVQAPPAAPVPPPSFEDRLRYCRTRTEDAIGERLSRCAEFRVEIAKPDQSLTYALEWKAENVFRAEVFIGETRHLSGFLADVAGLDEAALDRHLQKAEDVAAVGDMSARFVTALGCSDAEGVALGVAVLRLREEHARIVSRLCGERWSGAPGPWTHNSTNPVACIKTSCAADAQRDIYALIANLLDVLTTRVEGL